MSDIVKAAMILAAGGIAAVGIAMYYSPYHSCVRARTEGLRQTLMNPEVVAPVQCAEFLGGSKT